MKAKEKSKKREDIINYRSDNYEEFLKLEEKPSCKVLN